MRPLPVFVWLLLGSDFVAFTRRVLPNIILHRRYRYGFSNDLCDLELVD